MKVFTNTFDLAKASPHRFWVAPYSDFKIGIKILAKGEVVDKDFTVKAGAVELTPDEDKIDGFTLYTLKSGDTGFVEYTIEVEDIAEKLKLTQIVTDSTVFEVGGSGGGDVPADVATKTWVNSQISDFITEDALDGYATESYVDSATSDFVEEDELTAYATKAELTGYVETGDLTAYAEKADLTAYATKDELTAYAETSDIKDSTITFTQGGVTKGSFTLNQATSATIALDAGGGDMSNYYMKSETSSATEINTALAGKQPTGNYLTAETEPAFAAMSADIVVDGDLTAYVPLSGNVNMTGSLSVSTSSNGASLDASNGVTVWDTDEGKQKIISLDYDGLFVKNYNDTAAKEIEYPTKSGTMLVDADLTAYYTKSETSSATELTNAFQSKVAGGAETGTTGTPAAVNAVKSVYETDWATLSATADANTFYVVLPDPA